MIIVAAAVLVLAVSATIYAKTSGQSAAPVADQPAATTTGAAPAPATGSSGATQSGESPSAAAATTTTSTKRGSGGNYRPTATTGPDPGAPPADAATLAGLSCSLTVMENGDKSISLLFYAQGPAFFTVQKQEAGAWTTLKENVFYAGSGGIDAGSIPAGTDSLTLRLLKIENGKYTAASKAFTVSRPDVDAAGGMKSYKG